MTYGVLVNQNLWETEVILKIERVDMESACTFQLTIAEFYLLYSIFVSIYQTQTLFSVQKYIINCYVNSP